MKYNTIVIGCGISGITAAIYLKRANIEVAIFEKSAPGGQLLLTSTVENYPGLPSVEGSTLALNLYNQVTSLEIPVFFENIEEIKKLSEEEYEIKTSNKTVTCQNIIFATGRNSRKLGLENEGKLTGRGVSYCATCDGALYKGKDVIVVGAGNSAFEESLYLSNLCNSVTIIARRDVYRADATLIDKVKNKDNIKILSNKVVTKLYGEEKLEKIQVEDTITKTREDIVCDGLFIYIGQIPETALAKNIGTHLEDDYIKTTEEMVTNLSNVYACGDCRKKELYQLTTASYDGVIAANHIIKKMRAN